jgi:enamine deaminase RidA (YjgF/YER057c/UK114 family)
MINIKINERGKLLKKIFVISPSKDKETSSALTHIEEVTDCLNQINSIAKEYFPSFRILKMDVFVNCKNLQKLVDVEKEIRELVNNYEFRITNFELKLDFDLFDTPILIVAQPPANCMNVAVEVMALMLEPSEYSYEFIKNENSAYCKIRMGEESELCGVVSNSYNNNPQTPFNKRETVYEIALNGFGEMKKVLKRNNMNFDNVVRQWGYIGGITNYELRITNEGDKEVENYQMFNKARAEKYRDVEWKNGYPSATGIGANVEGCSLEFIALNETPNKIILPLHNPRQLDAHGYWKNYELRITNYELEAKDNESSINKKRNLNKTFKKGERDTPKFERGKIVITDNSIDFYISGTAAIIGEYSVAGNIQEQTKTTLDNITNLCSKENLKEHGIVIENDLPPFTCVKAYIKNGKDASLVEEMCKETFGDVPILCVIADVCRKELLVEIEAYLHCWIEHLI